MTTSESADTAVFHREQRTLLKHALYGFGFTALLVGLFWYRALVASDLAPSVASIPGISVAVAESLVTWAIVIILVTAGPLFVATTAYSLYRRANPVPALVIDGDGFTDRASLTSLGRVPWSDVERLDLVEQMNVPQLRVTLEDPARVLDGRGPLASRYLRLNRRVMQGDGAVPLHQLDATTDEVVAAIERYSEHAVER